MKTNKLITFIFYAVALGMGVASVILLILKESHVTVINLLAIAVVCLAFVGIRSAGKDV